MDFNKLVEEHLKEFDIDRFIALELKEVVKAMASDAIKSNIRKITEFELTKIILEEIDAQLKKSIQTDNGWGEKRSYDSFEQLFKELLIKRLNDTWGIKSEIKKMIESRVDVLIKDRQKEISKKIADELLKENNNG